MEYEVIIERGLLNRVGAEVRKIHNRKIVFIVTDDIVGELYEKNVRKSLEDAGFTVYSMFIPAGETSKSGKVLNKVYDFLIDNGASRKDLLIALGGGVVGDLSGFAAATYMRGMPFVQVPTSLLAQIDSSIGGKVAINVPKGKNLVGAFYNPKIVLIDPDCLNTLDERFLRDGAAEAIKYGCIKDKAIFSIFQGINEISNLYPHLDEIISRSCKIKLDIVEQDALEHGQRMLLNFGHTIGHAVESYYEYSRYTHGEAVAIGMAYIAELSEQYGFAKPGTADLIKDILKKISLPYEVEDVPGIKEALIDLVAHDKKNNSDTSNLILIRDIGDCFIKTVKTVELKEFFIEGGFI